MMELTARQVQVLDAIRSHIRERGYPPSTREIGEAIGVRSLNCVVGHLEALERKGAIERDHNTGRGLRVLVRTAAKAQIAEALMAAAHEFASDADVHAAHGFPEKAQRRALLAVRMRSALELLDAE